MQGKLDGATKYYIWRTLFKSRMWYQIRELAKLSKEIQNYTISYVYESFRAILGSRGKPSKNALFVTMTGLTPEEYIE